MTTIVGQNVSIQYDDNDYYCLIGRRQKILKKYFMEKKFQRRLKISFGIRDALFWNQTKFCLVPNQSEKGNYNPNLVWFMEGGFDSSALYIPLAVVFPVTGLFPAWSFTRRFFPRRLV